MLPDLPTVKERIDDLFIDHFHDLVNQKLGVFSRSPRHIVQEGESTEVHRADGTSETTQFKTASAEWMLDQSAVPTMTVGERLEKIEKAAEEMAAQVSSGLFESLGASLDKAGRAVDAKGMPFGAETVLLALESVELSFNDRGGVKDFSMVVPPGLMSRAKQAFHDIERDPALRAKYEALIVRKQVEWREREAARKLVG